MPLDFPQQKERFLKAYDQHADALFRYCYYRIGDREAAKDILQETFTRIWEYLSQGKQIHDMKPFLYRTATNLLLDSYKKKKSVSLDKLQEQGIDFSSDDKRPGSSESHLQVKIDGKIMLQLLKKIGPKYRHIIIMRYINDLSPQEIAKSLGLTENVVSVRIHRGLQKIRKLVDSH